ncbi:MAG: hypothetical protein E3J34_03565 [Dehalococcoidia bacterium]|nr:MAG: hypothetical protein E3J34_03565 [Dehalococcoidia bacterium]
MLDGESQKLLEQIESEAIRLGGAVKRGMIEKRELQEAEEIRVSIRPPKFLGSTELFTLRNLEPADYHLILVAIPRKMGSG